MTKLFSTIFILMLIFCSCDQNDKSITEKENELLKKENELLKKEQELKENSQQPTNSTTTHPTKSDNWKTFNHKYGFAIELPNYFSQGALTASGIQYYDTDIDPNISVWVETIGEGSQTSLIVDYQTYLNSTEGVSYKVLRDNFFVISGQNSEEIYYYKMLVKNNQTHFLSISYPKSQKDLFDNILPRISKSIR